MPSSKQLPHEAAIVRANAEFYRAFSRGDCAAMARVWAEAAPVACFHPGMPATYGREAVLQTWQQILSSAGPIEMRADHVRVHMLGDAAVVTCYEGNADHPAHLAATNVFVLETAGWRMVHHHAGPLARPIPKPDSATGLN